MAAAVVAAAAVVVAAAVAAAVVAAAAVMVAVVILAVIVPAVAPVAVAIVGDAVVIIVVGGAAGLPGVDGSAGPGIVVIFADVTAGERSEVWTFRESSGPALCERRTNLVHPPSR